MPHLYIRTFKITAEDKKKLAADVTQAVNKYVPAPTGYNHITLPYEWIDIPRENLAMDGKLDQSPMAYIIINFLEGRTLEQKKGVAKDVTAIVAKNLKIPQKAVLVEILELSPANVAHGGTLTIDAPPPGISI